MNAICKYRGHTYDEPNGACTVCGEIQITKTDPFVKEGLKYVEQPSSNHDDMDRLREEIVKCFYDEKMSDEDTVDLEEDIEYFDTKKVIDQLLTLIQSEVIQTKKAFGGCLKCYGKGYATVSDRWSGTDTDQDIGSPGGRVSGGKDFAMKFCSCERGKQLEQLTTSEITKGKIEGLKKAKQLVITRTEIPRDAKNPTRDLTVIIGEACAVVIEDEIYRVNKLNKDKE